MSSNPQPEQDGWKGRRSGCGAGMFNVASPRRLGASRVRVFWKSKGKPGDQWFPLTTTGGGSIDAPRVFPELFSLDSEDVVHVSVLLFFLQLNSGDKWVDATRSVCPPSLLLGRNERKPLAAPLPVTFQNKTRQESIREQNMLGVTLHFGRHPHTMCVFVCAASHLELNSKSLKWTSSVRLSYWENDSSSGEQA